MVLELKLPSFIESMIVPQSAALSVRNSRRASSRTCSPAVVAGECEFLNFFSQAGITAAEARELWLCFVALLVRPGCLTHLIVLGFGDAFLEHLRALASSLGIFIFSERVCCLPSG